MSRGGGLLAALLGAGGASAYYTGDALGPLRHIPGLGNLGTGFGQTSSYGGGGSHREMDDLKRLVEQLSRDFGRHQGFTIVTAPGGKGGSSAFAVVAVVTSAGVVYLRFWRGWRFSDMMYVTRSSLTKSITQVSAGLESVKQALQQRVDLVKAKLGGQLDELRAESKEAQDAMAEAQGALADHMRLVGDDVQGVQSSVRELEANLDEISLHQRTANEGIHLLCSVVGDLMKKTGYRMASVVELDKYVKRPRMTDSPRVQGLEGLLSIPEVSADPASQTWPGSRPGSGIEASRSRSVPPASEPVSPPVSPAVVSPPIFLRPASLRRAPEMDRSQSEPQPQMLSRQTVS